MVISDKKHHKHQTSTHTDPIITSPTTVLNITLSEVKMKTVKIGWNYYPRAPVLLLGLVALALVPNDWLPSVSLIRALCWLAFISDWKCLAQSINNVVLLALLGCLGLSQPPVQHLYIRGGATTGKASFGLHVPHSLSLADGRALSTNLGGGNCKWEAPIHDVPKELNFHKTLIAGFPSGDKRMIFIQMEALTGWGEFICQMWYYAVWYTAGTSLTSTALPMTLKTCWLTRSAAKDEWDFEYLGMSNYPFIKANNPHHEGIWGWEDAADQVVMMVRNIRKSMVECKCTHFRFMTHIRIYVWPNGCTKSFKLTSHSWYNTCFTDHDILWDIGCEFLTRRYEQSCSIVPCNLTYPMSILFYVTNSWSLDAKTWEEATLNLDKLYTERLPIEVRAFSYKLIGVLIVIPGQDSSLFIVMLCYILFLGLLWVERFESHWRMLLVWMVCRLLGESLALPKHICSFGISLMYEC